MAEWVTMGDGSQRAYADVTITVATDNDLSEVLDLNEYLVTAIQMPAALTSATIGFQVSAEAATAFGALAIDGTAISLAFTASQVEVMSPKVGNAMYRYLKISTASAEGSNRTFRVFGIKL